MPGLGLGLGLRKTRRLLGPAYDADAQLYFSATGITDATQCSAVNQLVLDLKSYSIWSNLYAFYPMVGGTAATHKFNLVNPVDSNGAYRLSFSSGWTHASTGATPNGTSAYADTFLVPTTVFNLTDLVSIGFYSRTSAGAGTNTFTMGSADAGQISMTIRRSDNTRQFVADFNGSTSYRAAIDSNSLDGSGFFAGSQSGTNCKLFRNGVSVISNTHTGTLATPGYSMYLGARNFAGSPNGYSARECAGAFIGKKLTDTQMANFYTAIQAFNTTLGRAV